MNSRPHGDGNFQGRHRAEWDFPSSNLWSRKRTLQKEEHGSSDCCDAPIEILGQILFYLLPMQRIQRLAIKHDMSQQGVRDRNLSRWFGSWFFLALTIRARTFSGERRSAKIVHTAHVCRGGIQEVFHIILGRPDENVDREWQAFHGKPVRPSVSAEKVIRDPPFVNHINNIVILKASYFRPWRSKNKPPCGTIKVVNLSFDGLDVSTPIEDSRRVVLWEPRLQFRVWVAKFSPITNRIGIVKAALSVWMKRSEWGCLSVKSVCIGFRAAIRLVISCKPTRMVQSLPNGKLAVDVTVASVIRYT